MLRVHFRMVFGLVLARCTFARVCVCVLLIPKHQNRGRKFGIFVSFLFVFFQRHFFVLQISNIVISLKISVLCFLSFHFTFKFSILIYLSEKYDPKKILWVFPFRFSFFHLIQHSKKFLSYNFYKYLRIFYLFLVFPFIHKFK